MFSSHYQNITLWFFFLIKISSNINQSISRMTLLDLTSELFLFISHELECDRNLNMFAHICHYLYSTSNYKLYHWNVELSRNFALFWVAEHDVEIIQKLLVKKINVCKFTKSHYHFSNNFFTTKNFFKCRTSCFSSLMLSIWFKHDLMTQILIKHDADVKNTSTELINHLLHF